MAERTCRDSRRQSFRRTVAESALSPDYLDRLELKRKQLDESIHKYIAQKEREFKAFEKELRHGSRLPIDREAASRRRTSSESTADTSASPMLGGQHNTLVDLPALPGLKRDRAPHISSDPADHEHTNTRRDASPGEHMPPSSEGFKREKDFVGVFTPGYLLALQGKTEAAVPRTSSAPPVVDKPAPDGHKHKAPQPFQRANSDPVVPANPKPAALLSLVSRTSSSGSSVDGRLTSAMKSSSQTTRPNRKRVSLAVGDAIVAPSDNVPVALDHNSTSSHSRMRSPIIEHSSTAIHDFQFPPDRSDPANTSPITADSEPELANGNSAGHINPERKTDDASIASSASAPPAQNSQAVSSLDPDGDLGFDMEEEDEDYEGRSDATDVDASDDDIAGRVEFEPPVSPRERRGGDYYESSEGFLPTPKETRDSRADAVDFAPGSALASRQPSNAGFRRPSVTHDPIYGGASYAQAEVRAVEDDVYGSSYVRPGSKGSFSAGSVGESLMDQFYSKRHSLGAETQPEVRG